MEVTINNVHGVRQSGMGRADFVSEALTRIKRVVRVGQK